MRNVITNYGATGNGSTDDTTAIQNAINDVSAGGGYPNQQLLFPAGVYKTTAQINIIHNNLNIIGEGPLASTISYQGAAGTGGIFGTVSGNPVINNISIQGMGFDFPNTNKMSNCIQFAISPSGSHYNWLFKNCLFQHSKESPIRAAQASDNIVIDSCEFGFCALAAYGGSPTNGGGPNGTFTNSIITNCYIHDGGQFSAFNHAIYINGGCQNVQIVNNRFENVSYDACTFGTSSDDPTKQFNLVFANNLIVTPGGGGLNWSNANNITVSNNSFTLNNNAQAITFGPLTYGWTISNNTITSSQTPAQIILTNAPYGIQARFGANAGTISGNTITYTQNYVNTGIGINVANATDIDIVGNTIINYGLGIGITSDNPVGGYPYANRINVRNNSIQTLDGAIDNTQNGNFYFGYNPATGLGNWAAIGMDGGSSNVYMDGNHIRNYPYGVVISNIPAFISKPPFTNANISIIRNRFYNVNYGLWMYPGSTAVSVGFENNFGCPLVLNNGIIRNFRNLKNTVDGEYYTFPGTNGSETVQ